MVSTFVEWLKAVSRRRFYVFLGISLVVAGIAFLLALKLSPWLYTANVHIRLRLQAPSETKINICWDKSQIECLPLVPYLSTEKRSAEAGEIADIWLSELPPRQEYAFTFIFKSKVTEGIFQDLELDSSVGLLWGYFPGVGIRNTKLRADQFNTTNITYTIRDGSYYFEGDPGARLTATREIKSGPPDSNTTSILIIWGLLFSVYLLFALPLYLLPFAEENRADATRNLPLPHHYPVWVYALCAITILNMLLLVINSPVMLYLSDQLVYLNIATRQTWFFYPPRPPGYYMFVAFILQLSNNSLNTIVVAQAIMLAASATLCIWTLRRWLHPFVVVPLICGVLFSPSQIHWTLTILRESLFASLVLLGMTAVIAHFTTPNKLAARIWLAVFALVCGLALFVRENGIILSVVLLPVVLPETLKYWKSPGLIWKRLQLILLLFMRYAAPVACTGIVYLGLSFYNYLNYGYFQFTLHVTSHHFLWQEIATSIFDPRGLMEADPSMTEEAKTYLGQRLYRSFILAREEAERLDPIYIALFPTVNQIMSEKGQPVNLFHSASILDEIGRNVHTRIPWEADLIGVVRQYREFVLSKPGRYILLPDDPVGLAHKQQLLSPMVKTIVYQGKPTTSIINEYYRVTSDYRWYRLIFFLALLFSIYLLRYHDPILLAPITFFLANALLMIMLRTEQFRYIESMDLLLILQVGLGLSRWIYSHSSVIVEKFHLLLT